MEGFSAFQSLTIHGCICFYLFVLYHYILFILKIFCNTEKVNNSEYIYLDYKASFYNLHPPISLYSSVVHSHNDWRYICYDLKGKG